MNSAPALQNLILMSMTHMLSFLHICEVFKLKFTKGIITFQVSKRGRGDEQGATLSLAGTPRNNDDMWRKEVRHRMGMPSMLVPLQ